MVPKPCTQVKKGGNLFGTLPVVFILYFCYAMKCYVIFFYSTGQDKTSLMPSISLFETKINSAQFFEKCKFNKD